MSRIKYNGQSKRNYDRDEKRAREEHDLGILDQYSRRIGVAINKFEHEFLPVPENHQGGVCALPPGYYYGFRPQTLRNGVPYGAGQEERYYPTPEERDRAVVQYLAGKKKRDSANPRFTTVARREQVS